MISPNLSPLDECYEHEWRQRFIKVLQLVKPMTNCLLLLVMESPSGCTVFSEDPFVTKGYIIGSAVIKTISDSNILLGEAFRKEAIKIYYLVILCTTLWTTFMK